MQGLESPIDSRGQ